MFISRTTRCPGQQAVKALKGEMASHLLSQQTASGCQEGVVPGYDSYAAFLVRPISGTLITRLLQNYATPGHHKCIQTMPLWFLDASRAHPGASESCLPSCSIFRPWSLRRLLRAGQLALASPRFSLRKAGSRPRQGNHVLKDPTPWKHCHTAAAWHYRR